ncbi:MAG: hypothetical protein ABJB49_07925 [Nitrospirota bacterium]
MRWRPLRVRGLMASLLSVLVICVACTNEPRQEAAAVSIKDTGAAQTGAASTTDSQVLSVRPASPPDTFAIQPVEVQHPVTDPVVLRDVRTAQQPTFDRMAFEFDGPLVPGYRVAYVDSVYECGSGERVIVRGNSSLSVSLSPAQAHTETGIVTIKGADRRLTLPVMKELKQSCDFEAEVSWVLGLSARKAFRVTELSSPARLVVDILH